MARFTPARRHRRRRARRLFVLAGGGRHESRLRAQLGRAAVVGDQIGKYAPWRRGGMNATRLSHAPALLCSPVPRYAVLTAKKSPAGKRRGSWPKYGKHDPNAVARCPFPPRVKRGKKSPALVEAGRGWLTGGATHPGRSPSIAAQRLMEHEESPAALAPAAGQSLDCHSRWPMRKHRQAG